jgi:hypothetical protein
VENHENKPDSGNDPTGFGPVVVAAAKPIAQSVCKPA